MTTKQDTAEYRAWHGMKTRCSNPKRSDWKNYGGRGISVCERWASFESFLADMGPKPSARHTMDRIDNDGNYEPGNCRWATWDLQSRNKRPREETVRFELRLPTSMLRQLAALAREAGLSSADVVRFGIRYMLQHPEVILRPAAQEQRETADA
jgi:hypothetical protein